MSHWRMLAATGLALAAATAAVAGGDFAAKEQEVVDASSMTLVKLGELLHAGKLDKPGALGVIQRQISPIINYQLLARTALGKHWRKTDAAQREQVGELFRKLLEKTYAGALARFSNQTIRHEPTASKGDQGTVQLWVNNKGVEISIEYVLSLEGDTWEITDVKIEKVSLLANYRRQFNSIIRKSGVDGLIELLRQKA